MNNMEDLRLCVGADDDDYIADWLMDFIYHTSGLIISDVEILKYLYQEKDLNESDQGIYRSSSRENKRNNDERAKRKNREIWEIHKNRFYHPFGYYPVDKHGRYTNEESEIAYYKRYDTPHPLTKFLKRQSNKKVRNIDPDVALRGGEYKKVYDYWWELY